MGKQILIYEVAVHEIINLIRQRNLKQGDKLPTERELAKQLEISRTCIREALQVLSSNYVVQIKQGSGIYVHRPDDIVLNRLAGSEFSREDALKIILYIAELRMLLETHGFQIAAQTITPEQLHRMYSHEANEYRLYLSDRADAIGPSMALEQLILSFQPNILLTNSHAGLDESWRRYMAQLDVVALPPDIRHRDHLDIIMAIEANSPKKIAKAVEKHLKGTIAAVERLMHV